MAWKLSRRQTLVSLALFCAAGERAFAQAVEDPDPWPDLAHMFFNDAPIQEDQSLVSFDAPKRAEDAALVPMSFSAKLPEGDQRRVVKLTLVIDQNPVPLAAAFTLGEKAGDTRSATARSIWRPASSRRQAGARRPWSRGWTTSWLPSAR
jgi:predicted secreted protein